ncbi:hypothetical protein [Magnetococcus sp. PR-3]|uniref:hypothetical protein n=1 Tax=Magnetococcus sp. PR-3 TaxID=3120355 RepID=UPI002FCE40C2
MRSIWLSAPFGWGVQLVRAVIAMGFDCGAQRPALGADEGLERCGLVQGLTEAWGCALSGFLHRLAGCQPVRATAGMGFDCGAQRPALGAAEGLERCSVA